MAIGPDGFAAATPPAARPGSLGAHSLIYLAGTALQGFGVLLVLPFATRLLGEAGFGQVSTSLVTVQLVGTLAAAGLPPVILREYHRGLDGPVAGRALAGAMVLLSLAVALVGTAVSAVVAGPGVADLGQWVLVVVGSAALTTVVAGQALSRANLKPYQFLLLAVLATLVAHLAGLLAAQGDRSPRTYLTGYVVALVVAAAAAVVVGRPVLPRAAPDRVRAGLRLAVPLLPQGAAMLGLLMGDLLLANRLLGDAAAGNYQVALQLGNIPFVLAAALYNAWGPLVLSHPATDRWSWTARSGASLATVVVIASGLVAVVAPVLVHAAAAESFDRATIAAVVSVLTLAAPVYMVYQGSMLAVLDNERTGRLALASVAALAVLVLAALALAPTLGLEGIAVAKVAAYTVLMVVTVLVGRRQLHWSAATWVALGAALLITVVLVATPGSTPRLVVGGVLLLTAAAVAPRVIAQLRR